LPKLPEVQRDTREEQFLLVLTPPAVPFYSGEKQYRVANVLRFVPAILCVLVGWSLGRRNNFTLKRQAGWAIFHLLCGIPGLLAFLAVQEWSPKEICSSCKKLRVVRRENCEHCGSKFAPPSRIGTEIFEPLTTD